MASVSPRATAAGWIARPRTSLIVRPRLLERLRNRFEVRLVVMTGGGGCGKSTVLAQAVDDATEGTDVWYSCNSADRDPARFGGGLLATTAAALGVEPNASARSTHESIAALILLVSPRPVCLVVDDAHHLVDPAPLQDLLEALPANGHLLLAGRHLPAVSTARLDAAGELARIEQAELLMTDDEQIEFANARGIDVARLAGAEGWPAFVELASAGTEVRSRQYLEEEAVTALEPDRRRRVAAFAAVGGGDDEVCRAVTGTGLDELLDGLPLVRWSDDTAQLHDLWAELLEGELSSHERRDAALAAGAVHRHRGRIDPAIDLGVVAGSGDDIVRTIAEAVRNGVAGGIHRDRLGRWSALLERHAPSTSIGALVDGLIAREHDSSSDEVWDLFDDAAMRFDEEGDDDLQLVALAQLGYVARCQYRLDRIDEVTQRIATLGERHEAALPFLAFCEAWSALLHARSDVQLAAMERIVDADLPTMWRVTRDHLHAHALLSLGRPAEALDWVPKNMADQPVPIPGSLTTEAQCHWAMGRPDIARAMSEPADAHRHGLRDRYMTTGWAAALAAYAGDVPTARRLARQHSELAGEQLRWVDAVFGPAIAALIDVARGDEGAAAAKVRALVSDAPLGSGPVEQAMRGHVAIPYVLVGETRPFWAEFAATGAMARAISLADAFVQSRESGSDRALSALGWPEPGVVATVLPARWAMEFALRGVAIGRSEGYALATWLCEHWGDAARSLLAEFSEGDRPLAGVASEVMATTPLPPPNRVGVRVLGRSELLVDGNDASDPNWRRERVRALLVWLLLNPNTTRQHAAGALWPDLSIERAAKNLRTTLNYLHGLLEPRRSSGDATWYVRVAGPQITLHHELDVDLWRYRDALGRADVAEREGRASDVLRLLVEAVGLWRGDLAEDLDHEWLDLERIHLRSRFVRASSRAAELLTATGRPNEAIDVLRRALAADPWHERSTVALAAAYEAVGDSTSARAIADRSRTLL